MRDDTSTIVDRGRYPDTVTPWEQEAWRDAALGWAGHRLAELGLRETGARRVRLRPWSVLVRVSVEGPLRAAWFKANPPASAFEAALGSALARWAPHHVLEPLAVDARRGWSLLPDGGDLFRDVLGRGTAGPRAWEEPLRQYAGMQRALIPNAGEIERLGVPGASPSALPGIFDRLVAGNPALEADDRARLRAFRPRLVDWCAELASTGIADTLDHADLHEGQLFHPEPGRFIFFDWGDAAVSHPFCSFSVPAGRVRELHGPKALSRLRDAYLEPWTGDGRGTAELRRALGLAGRLGTIGRARSWGRLFPGATRAAGFDGAAESAGSLLGLLAETPF